MPANVARPFNQNKPNVGSTKRHSCNSMQRWKRLYFQKKKQEIDKLNKKRAVARYDTRKRGVDSVEQLGG